MTARTAHIDETLVKPRKVLRARPGDDGLGYLVDLDCGHTIWFAVKPPDETYCGACLNLLVNQARMIQAEQRPQVVHCPAGNHHHAGSSVALQVDEGAQDLGIGDRLVPLHAEGSERAVVVEEEHSRWSLA